MAKRRTLIITEVALAIALAAVLNVLQLRLPINFMGGSISLAMLPIALVALRRGPLSGMVVGTAFGCIDLLIEPLILMPIQVILDYPLPYLLFGFGVGCYSKLYNKYANRSGQGAIGRFLAQGSFIIIIAVILGGILRLIPHTLSGVFFFSEYAGDFFAATPGFLFFPGAVDSGLNVWVYSIAYNATYLIPSLICVAVCLLIIAPILAKAVPVQSAATIERNKAQQETPGEKPDAKPE